MADPAPVALVRDVRERIADGHPWLWADALQRRTDLATGSEVDIVTPDGLFVGRGLWDARSPLAVRLWTQTRGERIDAALVHQRVEAACARRQRDVPLVDTDCLRLVHGEADHLPGLIADRYADIAVVQADTAAVTPLLPVFAAALTAALPALRHVVYKPQRRQRLDGGAALEALIGTLPDGPVRVRENGLLFDVDIARGHKTGAYLDQRDNRRRIRALSRGQRVLNLYAYTGWFAVYAAAGGAAAVTSVDVAAGAIEAARHNLALNGFDPRDPRYACVVDDAVAWLEAHDGAWDVVIVDPPSMATSAASLERAVETYRRVNRLAIARTRPGGTLLTCSCSSHVDERALMRLVDEAARDRGARVRIVGRYGAGPDHPTPRWFPEARYLKALQVVVDDPGQTRDVRPARRPDAYRARSDGAPERRPRVGERPGGRPSGRPGDRPSDRPGDRPGGRPGGRPSGRPDDRPSGRPGGRPSGRPGDWPSDRPGQRPGGPPRDRPDDRPGTPAGDRPAPPKGRPRARDDARPDAPSGPRPPRERTPGDRPTDRRPPRPGALRPGGGRGPGRSGPAGPRGGPPAGGRRPGRPPAGDAGGGGG